MIKIIVISFLLLLSSVNSFAQFGTQPFGQNPFSGKGAFGLGPYGSASSAGPNIPTDAMTFRGNTMTFNGQIMTFSGTP